MPALARTPDIRPLCYEHHREMELRKFASSDDGMAYVCQELDCVVHYSKSEGYFLNAQNLFLIKQGPVPPHQYCSSDGYPMYLLEVQPEHPSFRLWKCPKCSLCRGGGQLT
jgi:hypothetical protein